jgi:hypothetical protein
MNKDDASNKEVVTKFGLAGVPPPFILVISPKGHAVGGYTKEHATVDNLIRVIPSAKYDEVLDAINSKKPVFVVAARKSFTDKPAVLAECKNAAGKIPASASIVEIDMDDEQEAGFLKQIGVNTVATNTVTVVINATGNITGNFTGKQDAQALAAAANRVIKSCCPGGSSSGCAPPKK